jgi:hypothetical protein
VVQQHSTSIYATSLVQPEGGAMDYQAGGLGAGSTVVMVAHDAGGAEILSSLASQHSMDCSYVLQGPALAVFQRKLGPIKVTTLEHGISNAEMILCGTSWQSELELEAIQLARARGKRSVAFLDHWVCYRERFERNSRSVHPDEIWTGDAYAEALAMSEFPAIPIRLHENPYLREIRTNLKKIGRPRQAQEGGIAILYVCEPLSEQALAQYGDRRFWGYTEQEALRYFLGSIQVLEKNVSRVVIRPHPAESPQKYQWARDEFDLPIEAGGVNGLLEEIVASDVVVGCESMAMVVALEAGKRVLSSIPVGGKACSLPHAGIEHLRDLVNKAQIRQ